MLLAAFSFPKGAQELTLKADSTSDGPAHDHADWADACIMTGEGKLLWADEDRQPFVAVAPPFSFRYGDETSSNILRRWKQTVATKETAGRLVAVPIGKVE